MSEDTQQAIADDLGVSQKTVDRAEDELEEDGVKLSQVTKLNTDEKGEQVREFVEDNPTTPGPGGQFHRFVSGDSQRYSARGVCPGSRAPVRGFAPQTAAYSAVSYNRPARG